MFHVADDSKIIQICKLHAKTVDLGYLRLKMLQQPRNYNLTKIFRQKPNLHLKSTSLEIVLVFTRSISSKNQPTRSQHLVYKLIKKTPLSRL